MAVDVLNDEYVATPSLYGDEASTSVSANATVNKTNRQVLDFGLPSRTDISGLSSLLNMGDTIRGMKSFKVKVTKYLNHVRLADDFWNGVETSHAFLTGVKTPGQIAGLINRAPRGPQRSVAHRYFDSLSEANFQRQCDLYGIAQTDYTDKNAVIEALIARQGE